MTDKELLVRDSYVACLRKYRERIIAGRVDLKMLFQEMKKRDRTLTLKQFKILFLELYNSFPNKNGWILERAPELAVNRRYAVLTNQGWLYYIYNLNQT